MDKNLENFKNIFEREYTWKAGFMRNVARYPSRTAMIFPETKEEWTYSELNSEVNRLANAFRKDGVGKGSVVMYQLLNCPVFAFAYVATHKIGGVNCPVNYRLSAGEIALTIDDSKPDVFIYDAEQSDVVMQALELAKSKPKRIIMTDILKKASPCKGAVSYEEYTKDFPDTEPEIDFEPSIYDETTRLYTSGTTGRQKGVMITSINEVLSAHDVMIHFPMNHTDRTMNTTPWFHRGGLHCAGPAPTFYAGGTVVILRKFNAKVSLFLIEKYRLTFVVGVPTVLEELTFTQEKDGRDLSSLKGIVTMGSALERAACIKYQRVLTPNIFNGYGTTETFWNTFLRPFDLPDMAGTAGGSCVDDEVRIVKVYDDRRAEPDDLAKMNNFEVGEVIIRSPAKSAYCYYNNPEETEDRFYKGFMYTKDLGTWDENRYVSIAGRKDDMIISSGENIYPTQVEEILNSCPKVKECIVTAVPDANRGELVTAYVIKADQSLTYEELDKFCKDSPMIANYKRPRYYRFVAGIPINATGKKQHYLAKQQARDDLMNGLLHRV